MKAKLIAGLSFCLISARLTLLAAPGAGVAGPDDLGRFGWANSPDGKNTGDYIARGLRNQQMGNMDRALADYNTAIQLNSNNPDGYYYRGYLYWHLSKLNQALADMDTVVRLDPQTTYAYYVRGSIHAEMGHRDQALANFHEVIRQTTNTATGHLLAAWACKKMGDYPAAAAHYAKVKQMGPRDYDALNNVAWFKATCPDGSFRNGKEAVQESTKACELTKWKNGGFVDTLAAAWAEAGDFNQAVKYAEQALATSGLSASSRNEVQNHLRLFRQHKPWREQSKLKKGRS